MAHSSTLQESESRDRKREPRYTVFVRLPFARDDFDDPQLVQWDQSKDDALWNILSRSNAKAQDLNWNDLADQFDVTLTFLSQQAAWLYEKQLQQVRAQLRKVNHGPVTGTSDGSISIGESPMMRQRSGEGVRGSRGLASQTKERTLSHGEDNTVGTLRSTSGQQALSRKSSSNTVIQGASGSPLISTGSAFRDRHSSGEAHRQAVERSPKLGKPLMEQVTVPVALGSSSSESDDSSMHTMSRSRAFTRRPRYSIAKTKLNALSDADEEDDDEAPLFLPFSETATALQPSELKSIDIKRQSPTTMKDRNLASNTADQNNKHIHRPNSKLDYSSSSGQSQAHQDRASTFKAPPSVLSPRQRRSVRDGSDDSPSMGSSFSDLDNESVTQSALEEALADGMQQGGMASKMSTISQALRSRYL